jgi:hypothetical protein
MMNDENRLQESSAACLSFIEHNFRQSRLYPKKDVQFLYFYNVSVVNCRLYRNLWIKYLLIKWSDEH